ncbi:MAG: chloride channel protein [Cyclobacteriaceae bacterium]|nr:chloride channel protein [Cyclobacteriaceae bacterium]
MKKLSPATRLLLWRKRKISDRRFILFLSLFVGSAAGLGAVIIKNSVHFIQTLLTEGFSDQYYQFLFFLYPAIGILFTVIFINFILRRKVGHGIPNVLYGISRNSGIIRPYQTYASVITSALTVGFGGSVGLEGPTVSTGGAVGSNIGRFLRLDFKNIILLIACASAGAMAAIFKAPIASIIFALEVLMLDLTMAALLPLLIAAVSGTVTAYFFMGQQVLYPFEVHESFHLSSIPFYILFGIVCGFISLYFFRTYTFIERKFEKLGTWYTRFIIGAFILGGLIFFMPSLYGEGYQAINSSLHGNYNYLFINSPFYEFRENYYALLLALLAVIFFKVIATYVTFGAGGIGGIFAPCLFIGANAGVLFSSVMNQLFIKQIPQSNFALLGMAGLITGVIHAPLTAIFLIAEITGGYQLIVPLMIVAAFSYVTISLFEKNSVYTHQLAKRGELFTHDKDKVVLSLMNVKEMLETKFSTVTPDTTLGELVKVIQDSKRNVFPVIDEENNLHGIIHLNNIRHVIFKPELYENTRVSNLMYFPENFVSPQDSMEVIVQKFQSSGHYNLPVIQDGKYIGFVSRAKVLSKYRKLLKHFSED